MKLGDGQRNNVDARPVGDQTLERHGFKRECTTTRSILDAINCVLERSHKRWKAVAFLRVNVGRPLNQQNGPKTFQKGKTAAQDRQLVAVNVELDHTDAIDLLPLSKMIQCVDRCARRGRELPAMFGMNGALMSKGPTGVDLWLCRSRKRIGKKDLVGLGVR